MAVVLWECFAGRRLFRGEEAVDVLQEVMSAPIPTLRQIGAQIPQALDDVIARALSRDLETRHASALDLGQAIKRAAGPGHIGTDADVARLMEAMFGARMALRQEQVRVTIGSNNLADLLRESGLPARERGSTSDVPTGQLLAELAPPAPTGRYVVRADLRARVGRFRPRRVPWWSVAVAVLGIAVGVAVTLAAVANRAKPAPIVIRGASETTNGPAVVPGVTPRKVVVPLPFLSTHVAFDGEARDPEPATDVMVFDVPSDSGIRHRVSAVALDGTRAEGYLREEEGVARPDANGYTFIAPPSNVDDVRRVGGGRPAHPIGTVRNGFTKLR